MKKLQSISFFLFFALFYSLNSFAQQKLTEFSVKIPRPAEAFMVADQNQNLACIFQSNKSYEIDFLDNEYKVINTVISQKISADKNQKIVGAKMDAENCFVYFYNKKIKAFSVWTIRRSDGSNAYSRLHVVAHNDQFLRAFIMNNKLYVLLVPKHTNTLKVMVADGANLEQMSFNMEMPSFYATLIKGNDYLNTEAESEVGIEEISYDLENNIKSSYPAKKLYHFDNKIYFTFDEPGLTHFIIVDPVSKTSEYKRLNFTLDRGDNSREKQGNSFLYYNRFFRTTISPELLNVTIINLDSMSLINSYNFKPDEKIEISNGPIIQEGMTSNYSSDEKIIKRTDQYFRKVLNGNIGIAANPVDSNKYQLEVGGLEMFNTNPGYRPGFNGPTISIGMGMGMGTGFGMGMPYHGGYGSSMYGSGMHYNGFPGYYPYQSVTRLRITYFKSLLKYDDFSHVEDAVRDNMKDKINEYEYQVFRYNPPEVLRITRYQNSVLFGYYVKNGRRFSIVEFRK
ncbi:MAG: hypothetical protein K2X86_02465 [Cytophagaceae bacterium]|nr:hypothetical protein [Cytophagaceae bacterium]